MPKALNIFLSVKSVRIAKAETQYGRGHFSLFDNAGRKTAIDIARALVDAGAAACVNIFPGMRSIYRWEGETNEAAECALLIKTTAAVAENARRIICDLHPYDLPAIVALPVDEANSSTDYCAWLRRSIEFSI